MDRKAPPQSVAEVDGDPPSSKKIKVHTGDAVPVTGTAAAEVSLCPVPPLKTKIPTIDVGSDMNLQRGDGLEVKWTINDDDDSRGEGGRDGDVDATAATEDARPKDITVWWAATLGAKTGQIHALTPEESRESGEARDACPAAGVRVPVYTLNYAPLKEHGFETISVEDVAFLSNRTLLNLSTDEMMTFRRSGAPSPPPSPGAKVTDTTDAVISRQFAGQEEMGTFLNEVMQQCLQSTGMEEKMERLPAAEQLVMAERIAKAKEGFLANIVKETDKMAGESKVITADVVRRCVVQMKDAY